MFDDEVKGAPAVRAPSEAFVALTETPVVTAPVAPAAAEVVLIVTTVVAGDAQSLACECVLRANHANLGTRPFHTLSWLDALVELAVAVGVAGLGRLALAPLACAPTLKSVHDT